MASLAFAPCAGDRVRSCCGCRGAYRSAVLSGKVFRATMPTHGIVAGKINFGVSVRCTEMQNAKGKMQNWNLAVRISLSPYRGDHFAMVRLYNKFTYKSTYTRICAPSNLCVNYDHCDSCSPSSVSFADSFPLVGSHYSAPPNNSEGGTNKPSPRGEGVAVGDG